MRAGRHAGTNPFPPLSFPLHPSPSGVKPSPSGVKQFYCASIAAFWCDSTEPDRGRGVRVRRRRGWGRGTAERPWRAASTRGRRARTPRPCSEWRQTALVRPGSDVLMPFDDPRDGWAGACPPARVDSLPAHLRTREKTRVLVLTLQNQHSGHLKRKRTRTHAPSARTRPSPTSRPARAAPPRSAGQPPRLPAPSTRGSRAGRSGRSPAARCRW